MTAQQSPDCPVDSLNYAESMQKVSYLYLKMKLFKIYSEVSLYWRSKNKPPSGLLSFLSTDYSFPSFVSTKFWVCTRNTSPSNLQMSFSASFTNRSLWVGSVSIQHLKSLESLKSKSNVIKCPLHSKCYTPPSNTSCYTKRHKLFNCKSWLNNSKTIK